MFNIKETIEANKKKALILVVMMFCAVWLTLYGSAALTPVPLWQVWLGPNAPPPTTTFALASCSNIHRNTQIVQRVVTSNTIKNWLNVHPYFAQLDFVEQSDYLRIELLHKYGGFWLDADVVCLNSLERLISDSTQWDVSGAQNRADYSAARGTVFNQNTIGPVRANTATTQIWHKTVWRRMDSLTPRLQRCSTPYPYPRVAGVSVCGVKWGELVDFINDDLWPMAGRGELGFGLTLCDKHARPLGFTNTPCDVFHLGQASGHALQTVKSLCMQTVMRTSYYANSCCMAVNTENVARRVSFALDFKEFGGDLNVRCFSKQPAKTIVVTALWNIKRATNGDGRSFNKYVAWLQTTLKINAAMMVFADASTIEKVRPHRDAAGFPTCYVTMQFEDHPYYKRFFEKNRKIVTSASYRKHIQHPRRVEVVNAQYNIIQWGKIELMRQAIVDYNPFDSQHVVWFDAGVSRFMQEPFTTTQPYVSSAVTSALSASGRGLYVSVIPGAEHQGVTLQRICKQQHGGQLYLTAENLFAGTVLMASKHRIGNFASRWSSFIEHQLRHFRTAQDQIMLQMMWCQHPSEIQPVVVKDTHQWMGFHEVLHGIKSYSLDNYSCVGATQ